MANTKKLMKAAAMVVAERAKVMGKKAAKRMAIAGDAALIKAGRAAERRQRARAVKAGLKKAGKAVLVAGAAVATAAALRRAARKRGGAGAGAT